MKIGCVTVSDRAFAGAYRDQSGPEIQRVLREAFGNDTQFIAVVVPDNKVQILCALLDLVDAQKCELVVTTGGTGIGPRDVTPEATRAAVDIELPGFGEIMRVQSFARVRTSILSRGLAGVRGSTLIINLPGRPTAVAECLTLLSDAIREGVEQLGGRDPHAPVQVD